MSSIISREQSIVVYSGEPEIFGKLHHMLNVFFNYMIYVNYFDE